MFFCILLLILFYFWIFCFKTSISDSSLCVFEALWESSLSRYPLIQAIKFPWSDSDSSILWSIFIKWTGDGFWLSLAYLLGSLRLFRLFLHFLLSNCTYDYATFRMLMFLGLSMFLNPNVQYYTNHKFQYNLSKPKSNPFGLFPFLQPFPLLIPTFKPSSPPHPLTPSPLTPPLYPYIYIYNRMAI